MTYRGSIRHTGSFANRGYRIDEERKTIIIVIVRYTPAVFRHNKKETSNPLES